VESIDEGHDKSTYPQVVRVVDKRGQVESGTSPAASGAMRSSRTGLSQRPPLRRAPPLELELEVIQEFEPPRKRIDEAAFIAKTLGERFFAGLARHGMSCTRLAIVAVTESGEERLRVWRCAEPLTARATADRVRWQCEGWLTATPGDRPRSGIIRLRLLPEELVGGEALQLQRAATPTPLSGPAGRAMVRIQGLLGPEAVLTPLLDGGRSPAERVRLIPWGDPRAAGPSPWPGRLPAPSPATVLRRAVPAGRSRRRRARGRVHDAWGLD
jgi:protein ImuB